MTHRVYVVLEFDDEDYAEAVRRAGQFRRFHHFVAMPEQFRSDRDMIFTQEPKLIAGEKVSVTWKRHAWERIDATMRELVKSWRGSN